MILKFSGWVESFN